MEIFTKSDLKNVAGEMHDSEFSENDFGYDSVKKIFYLNSCSEEFAGKKFHLELYNVEEYNPLNLEKMKEKKATGGIFNDIVIKEDGRKMTILSQDLKIILKLSILQGKFEVIQRKK